MVYKKTTRSRRVQRKKSNWYNKKRTYSYAGLAKQIWNMKGLINSERFQYTKNLTLTNAQVSITQLNDIAQGDTNITRTGNSIFMRSLTMKGYLQANTSSTVEATKVMVAVVVDTQQIGDTTPNIGDIFVSGTDPHSFLNTNTPGRFKILKRWQYILTSKTGDNPAKNFEWYHDMRLHAKYNGTGAGDIQKNGIYLVTIGSEASLFPTIYINNRISYHDN